MGLQLKDGEKGGGYPDGLYRPSSLVLNIIKNIIQSDTKKSAVINNSLSLDSGRASL